MKDNILDSDLVEQVSLKYGSFGTRFLSYIIDIIPFVFIAILILYFGFAMSPLESDYAINATSKNKFIGDPMANRSLIRYLALIIWIVYSMIVDSSVQQGTFGKKSVQLKVVNERGERISRKQSILRNAMKIVSYIPLGLGFLWSAFDKENRTWHDMIAKTYVVRG